MATTLNFAHDQGTNFSRVLTITSDAVPPVPIDVTGYIFRGQARVSFDKPIVLTFAFAIRVQVGADIGKVDMTLLPADTSSLVIKAATSYVYDVEMVDAAGIVTRLFQGSFVVSPEVTK